MPLLEWRNEYEIGIPGVDKEHYDLIALINRLFANLVESRDSPLIGDFLGEVHAKVAAHFALEEKEMRDRRYQGYPEHKTDHETLLDEIRSIMDMHDTGGYAATGNDLADALTRWFGSHFRLHDARFHHAIIGKSAT